MLGFPIPKMVHNPGGDWESWVGGRSNVFISSDIDEHRWCGPSLVFYRRVGFPCLGNVWVWCFKMAVWGHWMDQPYIYIYVYPWMIKDHWTYLISYCFKDVLKDTEYIEVTFICFQRFYAIPKCSMYGLFTYIRWYMATFKGNCR